MGTVLITGGAGFIGTRLAGLLVAAGENVVLLDRAFSPVALRVIPAGVERRTGDVTDRAALWATIADVKPQSIVHLAAILSSQSEIDPALAFDINIQGTFNVLEGGRRVGVTKVVATSSSAVYEAPDPAPLSDENTRLASTGVYGLTKSILEELCAFYHRRWGIDTRVARPGAVVGFGREATGAASNFTTAIISEPLAGRPYVCPVNEDDASPVVYQSDLVEGLAKLYLAPSVSSRVYNLGACNVSAGALAQAVRQRIAGARVTFEPDEVARFVVGRWKHIVQDNRLAARDFGYVPKFDTVDKLVDAYITEAKSQAVLA